MSVAANRIADRPQYPGIADDYRSTFATLQAMKADVFLAPHPEQFDLAAKKARIVLGAPNPFVDPTELPKRVAAAQAAFETELKGAAGRKGPAVMTASLLTRADRIAALKRIAKERILVLDGSWGVMFQREGLEEADFRGERFAHHDSPLKGDNDLLCLTRPDLVTKLHDAYFGAGADISETNTFNATTISQSDYHLEDAVVDINLEAARLGRESADRWTAAEPHKPRFLAGAIGPLSRTLSISPDVNDPGARSVTFQEVYEAYVQQARALHQGGVDLFLIETIFDTLNAKAAIKAVMDLEDEGLEPLPIWLSGTITDRSGRTLSGQTVEAFWNSVRHAKPFAVGLNCALGAELMRPQHRGTEPRRRHPGQRLPQRGPAQRLRPVRRGAARDGPLPGGVGAVGPRQHRRRLLRHHARAHPLHRRQRPGPADPDRSRSARPPCGCRASNPSSWPRTVPAYSDPLALSAVETESLRMLRARLNKPAASDAAKAVLGKVFLETVARVGLKVEAAAGGRGAALFRRVDRRGRRRGHGRAEGSVRKPGARARDRSARLRPAVGREGATVHHLPPPGARRA